MTKPRKAPPSDPVVAAHRIVARLTKTEEAPPKAKDPAAVSMGRKGGKARGQKLTLEQLREIGRKGAAARWGKSE
jgi:hypothetical protein